VSHAGYVPNLVQDSAGIEVAMAISNKLRAGVGGWVCLHGETLSGLTTVLYRLCRSRLTGLNSPWLLRMTPIPHLIGVRAALLHAMRLPNESIMWKNTTIIPRFLSEYLIHSKIKVMLIDDAHLIQKLGKLERSVFTSIMQAMMEPPYSVVFVLAGNFSIFQPKAAGWSNFELEPLHSIKKFGSSKDVQEFSNAFLAEKAVSMPNLTPYPLMSIDDASTILNLTKGYIGEVVAFMSIFAREYQGVEYWAVGVNAFDRARSRYRPRYG
jgi:hypothetical protein